MIGTVKHISSSNIGVEFDEVKNESSSYGVFWFLKCELETVDSIGDDEMLKDYTYVAKIVLLEDSYKKDYYFALFDAELQAIQDCDNRCLVVVNARGKDRRVLGEVKEIISGENFEECKVTSEVVGVVDMRPYDSRVEREEREKEIAKKKAAIEKKLNEEIAKRKNVEFYEQMAIQYPEIAELVKELKEIGGE